MPAKANQPSAVFPVSSCRVPATKAATLRATQAANGMSLPTYSPYCATRPLSAKTSSATSAAPTGSRLRASQ